ncbi:hypothetical protein [Sorangium sp. So ce887]|uniref:hypothetical protein n=1 Tax=Sorangium sp. So ce887 TaxID=3133324 RepID=UPI003F5D8527
MKNESRRPSLEKLRWRVWACSTAIRETPSVNGRRPTRSPKAMAPARISPGAKVRPGSDTSTKAPCPRGLALVNGSSFGTGTVGRPTRITVLSSASSHHGRETSALTRHRQVAREPACDGGRSTGSANETR